VPLLFFSISQSKRPQYILPLMPAVALLVTRMWRDSRGRVAGARGTAVVVAVFGLILSAAAFDAALVRHLKPELQLGARTAAFGIGVAALAGGIIAAVSNRSRRTVLVALSLPVMAIPLCSAPLLQDLGQLRSTAGLVRAAAPGLTADTVVIGVGEYESSLPFYLRRKVEVASADGSELTSNYLIRHFDEWTRRPGSTLHPMSWFEETLGQCCRPRLYIVRANDSVHRARLQAAGIPLLASNGKIVCYGPYRGPRGAR
jgi:4-amino-4-deoxy-L-arabinose transferase-like glycosyltransferase